MRGNFVAHAPSWDGVVVASVNGEARCGAVVITPRLALSIASCFLTLPLTDVQQTTCLQGSCEGAVVPVESVRLVGGPDARVGVVVARVTRIAVRFTAPWAIPICTKALCGEGWDVAMLELNPSCDHGPMACLAPVGVATVPATIGLAATAVGYGANPEYDRRAEYDLALASNGSGVRRSVPTRVRQVASRQLLSVEVAGSASGEGAFCYGDRGAALISQRGGEWELDGLHVPSRAPSGFAVLPSRACVDAAHEVWSVHASRCWIEATARRWGVASVVEAHRDQCGERDFYPPEVDASGFIGGGGAGGSAPRSGEDGVGAPEGGEQDLSLDLTRLSHNCSTTTCEQGVCVGSSCVCAENWYGPRCTLEGPPPSFVRSQHRVGSVVVSPTGSDEQPWCGTPATPCRTLRHALARQYWQLHGGGGTATITLLDGVFSGEGNRELVLHGNPVRVYSLRGPEHVQIDCRDSRDGSWGALILRGESDLASLTGVTLRKCLVDEQVHSALAPHPQYAAHVEGPARWPSHRAGLILRGNRWISG
jgi:hypothetical protein